MKQKDDAKEKILLEAIKLFLKKGYYGATTNELVRLAGVSKGALYWHFKDKEDILHHILDRYHVAFLNKAIKEIEDCPGDFTEKFKTYFKFTTEFARDNQELLLVFVSLLVEFAGSDSELEKRLKKLNRMYIRFVENLIEYGLKDGSVKKGIDPFIYARLIASIMMGSHLQWYLSFSSGEEDTDVTKQRAIIQRNEMFKILLA